MTQTLPEPTATPVGSAPTVTRAGEAVVFRVDAQQEAVGPAGGAATTERKTAASDGDAEGDGDRGERERQSVSARRGDPERIACGLGELGAGLVAVVRRLGERFCDHRVGGASRRRRLVLEVGVEDGGVVAALERLAAGQALVEQTAERVDVGAAVDRVAADLLGGDVVDRAHQLAVAGR